MQLEQFAHAFRRDYPEFSSTNIHELIYFLYQMDPEGTFTYEGKTYYKINDEYYLHDIRPQALFDIANNEIDSRNAKHPPIDWESRESLKYGIHFDHANSTFYYICHTTSNPLSRLHACATMEIAEDVIDFLNAKFPFVNSYIASLK